MEWSVFSGSFLLETGPIPNELIECGVDYITVTATRPPRSATLYDVAKEHLQREAEEGNEVRRWKGLTYSGYICGSVQLGTGPQGTIARVTGGTAKEAWRELYHWSSKCTRIDVQATIRVEGDPADRIQQDWETVCARWAELKNAKEPKLRVGPLGPETIEIGSRQSERFGRIYDKRKESKLDHYQQAVRFEVEYKGSLAGVVSRALIAEAPAVAATIPHISSFFRRYRVELPVQMHVSSLISAPRKESDATKKIRYLHTSIRPLVQFLISRGMEPEVREALGLPAVADNSR